MFSSQPPPDFYQVQLTFLGVFCLAALLLERYYNSRKAANDSTAPNDPRPLNTSLSAESKNVVTTLRRNYLLVYAIVMAADWLQGPYIYSLYREQYGYSERAVGFLFVTGFTAAGASAPLVGVWADKYGRKKMCMNFCVAFGTGCLCAQFSALPVLVFGRIASGLGTAILFSCFETWVISSSQSSGVSPGDLSSILGQATLINGFVATTAGIASNELVGRTQTFTSPFVLGAVLLVFGWVLIGGLWAENYGAQDSGGQDVFQLTRLGHAWSVVRRALALASSYATTYAQARFWAFCVFEVCVGMYYPVQGMLKGSLIANDYRATLASLFRVPLNAFVTTVMLTGISSDRQLVFSGCTATLAFSSIMTMLVIVKRTSEIVTTNPNGS
ncbi:hypothetical protein FRB99_008119 [Tulasnella sp. 403]|nr:hypothetical protein FRB99_008119 [Tulasnella sp. 403]